VGKNTFLPVVFRLKRTSSRINFDIIKVKKQLAAISTWGMKVFHQTTKNEL
jgi:hypothetical protein